MFIKKLQLRNFKTIVSYNVLSMSAKMITRGQQFSIFSFFLSPSASRLLLTKHYNYGQQEDITGSMTLLAAYLTTYVLILSTGVGETIFGGAFLDEHNLLDAGQPCDHFLVL